MGTQSSRLNPIWDMTADMAKKETYGMKSCIVIISTVFGIRYAMFR